MTEWRKMRTCFNCSNGVPHVLYGNLPVAISTMLMPSDHTSLRMSYWLGLPNEHTQNLSIIANFQMDAFMLWFGDQTLTSRINPLRRHVSYKYWTKTINFKKNPFCNSWTDLDEYYHMEYDDLRLQPASIVLATESTK